ncbi:MAG TPA: hypothetical protein VLC28_04985, partial [Flavitalea sp.]|nr:hypothetical protein [Flavitalea sp.]
MTTGFEVNKSNNELNQGPGNYLEFLVREPKGNPAKRRAVVLLHGVGSNEQDLFQFADVLPADCYIISPRAPL